MPKILIQKIPNIYPLPIKYSLKKLDNGGGIEYPTGGNIQYNPSFQRQGTTEYDSVPDYLYYIKAFQDGNVEAQNQVLGHITGIRGGQTATDLQFLSKNLKNSSLNDIAKRGISTASNPEMKKLYNMVNENPNIINQFDYVLPSSPLLAKEKDGGKFALGGSAYRNKIIDYLYEGDDEDDTPKAVTQNTAPSTEEVEKVIPQDNQEDLIAMALASGNNEIPQQFTNPYKLAKANFTSSGKYGTKNISPIGEEIASNIASGLGYTPSYNSIYRDPSYNQIVGGKPTSKHLKGEAVDVKPSDWNNLSKQKQKELMNLYTVINEKDHFHVQPKRK